MRELGEVTELEQAIRVEGSVCVHACACVCLSRRGNMRVLGVCGEEPLGLLPREPGIGTAICMCSQTSVHSLLKIHKSAYVPCVSVCTCVCACECDQRRHTNHKLVRMSKCIDLLSMHNKVLGLNGSEDLTLWRA